MHRDIYLQNYMELDQSTTTSSSSSLQRVRVRGSKLGHVWESRHYATAQGTAWDLHVTDSRPLISFDIKALNFRGGGEALVSPDHKQAVVNNCNAKVTTRHQHGGHFVPSASARVVDLHSGQTTDSRETTNLLEKKCNIRNVRNYFPIFSSFSY